MKKKAKQSLTNQYLADSVVETIELLKARKIFGHQGQAIKSLIQMSLQESRKDRESGLDTRLINEKEVKQIGTGKG